MTPGPKLPNIVVLHCHDLGRFTGAYGNATVRTPNLDALSSSGVRFDQAFCTAPQCSPSRAALFTGRVPHVNGVMGLAFGPHTWDLGPEQLHLAARLGEAGYHRSLLGVQHESQCQGIADRDMARRLGFDHVNTCGLGLADDVSHRALEFLQDRRDRNAPFYLQIGFYEPHRMRGKRDPDGTMGFLGDHLEPDDTLGVAVPPYLVDNDTARLELAELQGAVHHMDRAAGRVLDQLEELGMADETLVVFTTDHGLALPRAKCSLYDPGMEVALLARYPARRWAGGQVRDELVSHLDIVPTILELAGLPEDTTLHGKSLVALLDGKEQHWAREALYGEMTYHDYYDPRRSIRTRRYKLIANFTHAPASMDPTQSWNRRCIPVVGASGRGRATHPHLELYDLELDPNELTDLANSPREADILGRLVGQLGAWMEETDDPLLEGAVTSPFHREVLRLLSEDQHTG